MDNQTASSQESAGADTMDFAPSNKSQEHLQSGGPSSSVAHDNYDLATLIGPPGTSGTAFPHTIHHDGSTSPTDNGGAKLRKKFKNAVDHIRAARRLQSGSVLYTGGVAAEPGLDYRTMDVEGFNGPTEVTVIDYSSRRCSTSKKMKMLEDFQEFFEYDRPKWAKVRWINVDGLNWPCIKLLATKYNLHRLAIEDLLSVQRTKMDLYSDRGTPSCRVLTRDTYVCLLLHVLIGDDNQIVVDDEDSPSLSSWVEERTPDPSFFGKLRTWFKGNKADNMVRDAETATGMDEPQTLNVTPMAQHRYPDRKYIYDQVNSTRDTNLTVAVEQVSIFLTNDGTVITFFQQSGRAVEKPIVERLASDTTILRTSEDASLLLQSIVDAVVDLSFPIATAYQELIADLEIDVLTNPQMQHTRELHIVSGELNILKRTLYPLYNMINALRDHRPTAKRPGHFGVMGSGSGHQILQGGGEYSSGDYEEKTRGADISAAARIYLSDVADHVLILTEEVDMLKSTVENMINMIFNIVASTQNESMRQLTMASLIFLPLTFITGYFGMNFNQEYWRVLTNNGPMYFWQIAIPTTLFVMVLLMFSYIQRLMRTARRQVMRRGVKIQLRKNREMRRHHGARAIPRIDTTTKLTVS